MLTGLTELKTITICYSVHLLICVVKTLHRSWVRLFAERQCSPQEEA